MPGVAPQELVTRVDDPIIANRGDGSFHPVDPKFVADALGGIDFPVDQVDAVVYVLPYPRRAGLESAAGPGAILLAPGVRAVDEAQVHATVAHEFGHVVQYQFATVGSRAWAAYLKLRGLPTSEGRSTSHADNPREIFAEDFRALCGSPLARTNGTIENAFLAAPQTIEGLAEFLLDLPDRARRVATVGHTVAVYPNPFRIATTIQFTPRAGAANSTAAPVRLIRIADVRGRIVRHESVPPWAMVRPRGAGTAMTITGPGSRRGPISCKVIWSRAGRRESFWRIKHLVGSSGRAARSSNRVSKFAPVR